MPKDAVVSIGYISVYVLISQTEFLCRGSGGVVEATNKGSGTLSWLAKFCCHSADLVALGLVSCR